VGEAGIERAYEHYLNTYPLQNPAINCIQNPHSVQNVDFQLRNLQFIEIVNLSSEHEIPRFNFLVALKGHPNTAIRIAQFG